MGKSSIPALLPNSVFPKAEQHLEQPQVPLSPALAWPEGQPQTDSESECVEKTFAVPSFESASVQKLQSPQDANRCFLCTWAVFGSATRAQHHSGQQSLFKWPFSPEPAMVKDKQKHRSEALCPQTSMGILSLTPLEPGSHPVDLYFRLPVVDK